MGNMDNILSSEDHEHFLPQGYVVVRNAVEAEIIERAVAALEGGDEDPDFDPAAACTTDVVHSVIGELFGPEYGFEKKYAGQDMMRPLQKDVAWAMMTAHVAAAYPPLMPNEWALGSCIFLTQVNSRTKATFPIRLTAVSSAKAVYIILFRKTLGELWYPEPIQMIFRIFVQV